jgi:hypothetical protein
MEACRGLVVEPLVEAVRQLAAFDPAETDPLRLSDVLSTVARAEACLTSARLHVVGRLTEVSPTVQFDLVAAEQADLSAGARAMEHAEVMARYPALSAALAAGTVMGWVPAELAAARRSLPVALRPAFDQLEAEFLLCASFSSRGAFADTVRHLADEVLRQAGVNRRERQRRGMRCRTWTERDTGMSRLSAHLDPDRGVVVAQRLDEVLRTLMADPSAIAALGELPDDPAERTLFLRAHALFTLLTGGGPGVAAPEVVVVVDARGESRDSAGRPSIDTGSDLVLHHDTLAELLGRAVVHIVEVDENQPLAPDSVANRGRRLRHPSAAQRRLLRSIHPTCAARGCRVPFRNCDIHHIREWRHGGLTNLAELVPLCRFHHRWLHAHGARLELGHRRACTVHFPDGRTLDWPAPCRAGPFLATVPP